MTFSFCWSNGKASAGWMLKTTSGWWLVYLFVINHGDWIIIPTIRENKSHVPNHQPAHGYTRGDSTLISWDSGILFQQNGIAFFQNVATIENLRPRLHLYLSNVDPKNPGTTTPLQPLGPCDCTSRRGHAFLVGLFLPAPGRSVAKHFGSMFGF